MPGSEKLSNGEKRAVLQDTIDSFEDNKLTAIHPSINSGLDGEDLIGLSSLQKLPGVSSLFQQLLYQINNNEKLNISELNLEGLISMDKALDQMMPFIAESKKIKTLILSSNNLAWDGAEKKLINIFSQNKHITYLDIKETEISGETLANILKVNKSITHIAFDRGTKFISDKQAKRIDEELKSRQEKAQKEAKSEEKLQDPSSKPKPTSKTTLVDPLKSTRQT